MPERSWRFRLIDIRDACRAIEVDRALSGSPIDERRRLNLIERHLAVIGEAVRHLPEPVTALEPSVPWKAIIATRNVIVHGYFSLDDEMLQNVAQTEVPSLLAAIERLLEATGTTPDNHGENDR